MYPRYRGPAARLATDTAGLRAILAWRCGALNDRASSCGGRALRARMPPRASAARGAVFRISNGSIVLCGPIARASRTSRAAAPFSATRGSGKPARAGSEFVLNRHRRMNGTRVRDVSLESYEIGMSHNAVGNIDGEVVGGIARSTLRHEDQVPGTIISGTRVCHRCRGDKAGGCNQPE
jgi:hypothetical protein